jgi:hypothetical protein
MRIRRKAMNDEIKQYLKNYLGDLEYWRGTHSIEDLNHITSGTPTMESQEQFAAYIKPLEDLLTDEDIRLKKGRIGSLQHWERQFLEGGVDDENRVFIVQVLASERRELERRVEAYEMKEEDGTD